ncbi:MAG: HAD hydrolase family protein [Lachnospiraceae bacterium]
MNTKKKYFFFDIDGTLVPVSGARDIPESTKKALQELREKGHFCAIATGRSHCLAEPQRMDLEFENMVCDGGNGIVLDGKLIGIEPLDRELCIQLAKQCDERGITWGVSVEDKPMRLTKYQAFIDRADNFYQRSTLVEDLDIESFPQILKMFVACDPGVEKDIPALHILPWVRYEDAFIFVEPTDKAVGIRKVQEIYHIDDEDIVVFGDGMNDVSMFLPQWKCIAMGNAVPELKERASFVTKNAADDGIVYALKHFGWID